MSGRRERWDDRLYLPDAKAHVPNHSTHFPDWWRLTGALTYFATHIHRENCLEKKSYFSPHTIHFSFHFFYVKTAVDNSQQKLHQGKRALSFPGETKHYIKETTLWMVRGPSPEPLSKDALSLSDFRISKQEGSKDRNPSAWRSPLTGKISCPLAMNPQAGTCVMWPDGADEVI